MVRKKEMIALPEDYWTAIENKIDGVLIRSKGDALITLLRELQQAKPESVKFDEMVYIKASEFTELKNELAFIKNVQSKQMFVLEQLNKLIGSDVLTMSEASIALELSKIETSVKGWGRVGNDGLAELRRIGYFKKKETEGAPGQQ